MEGLDQKLPTMMRDVVVLHLLEAVTQLNVQGHGSKESSSLPVSHKNQYQLFVQAALLSCCFHSLRSEHQCRLVCVYHLSLQ